MSNERTPTLPTLQTGQISRGFIFNSNNAFICQIHSKRNQSSSNKLANSTYHFIWLDLIVGLLDLLKLFLFDALFVELMVIDG